MGDRQAPDNTRPHTEPASAVSGVDPGKRSRTTSLPVQRRTAATAVQLAPATADASGPTGGTAGPTDDPFALHLAGDAQVGAIAERGTRGAGGALPHLDVIQRSFGRHDVGGIRAHTDDGAAQAARAIGAEAYATGHQVAFAGAPTLHTAAHEAAHVVQQRHGVHLAGGVGHDGDRYERHADAVADAVVRGESAEALLDAEAGAGGATAGSGAAVQRKIGYEFETNVLVREKSLFGKTEKELKKADTLTAKNGLEMQVDTNPKNGSNIEFVSDAFPVSPAGKQAAKKSLDQLVAWCADIDGLGATAETGYKRLKRAVFAAPLDKVVRINTGSQLDGNPQVSAGLALDEVQGVLDGYHDSHKVKGSHNKTVNDLFRGVLNHDAYTRIIAAGRQLTRGGDEGLRGSGERGGEHQGDLRGSGERGGEHQGDLRGSGERGGGERGGGEQQVSKELQALVWMMGSYLKTIDLAPATKLGEPYTNSKEVSVILSRNNFAMLFATLPEAEQRLLREDPGLLVDAIAVGATVNVDMPIYPFGFAKGRDPKPVAFGLLRRDWITRVTTGVDLLTKAAWADDQEVDEDHEQHREGGKQLHKSLGEYKKMDTDRGYEQAVFEFRKIGVKQRPDAFRDAMLTTWDYLESKMTHDQPNEK